MLTSCLAAISNRRLYLITTPHLLALGDEQTISEALILFTLLKTSCLSKGAAWGVTRGEMFTGRCAALLFRWRQLSEAGRERFTVGVEDTLPTLWCRVLLTALNAALMLKARAWGSAVAEVLTDRLTAWGSLSLPKAGLDCSTVALYNTAALLQERILLAILKAACLIDLTSRRSTLLQTETDIFTIGLHGIDRRFTAETVRERLTG